MDIISKEISPQGSCGRIQSWELDIPPEGYAEFPETLDTTAFYAYNGFVTLTIETVERTHKVSKAVPVQKFGSVAKRRVVDKTIINEDGEEETTPVVEVYYEDEPYWGSEIQIVDEPYTVDVVTSYAPNVEAWEVWRSSLPEPVEPEPTTEERVVALEEQMTQTDETMISMFESQALLEEQLAQTDEANIALFESLAAQEEVNAEQDNALIDIYEMIGGLQ